MNLPQLTASLASWFSLIRSRTFKNIGIAFAAQIASKAFSAAALMVLVRYLSLQEFGAVSVVQSVIAISAGIVLQGVNWATIREIAFLKGNEQQRANLARGSLWATLAVSAAIASAAWAIFCLWETPTGNDVLGRSGAYVALGIVCAALMNHGIAVMQGREEFKLAAVASVAQALLLAILYYGLARLHLLSLSVVLVMIAVAPLTTFLIYLARGVGVAGDALLDLQGVRHILGKARWYVLYSSLLAVSGQLDVLMMARYFSYVDVAVYSVASKLFSIFVLGLGAIHSVLLPRMSSMKDPDVLRSILLRSLRFSLPAAGVVLIVTAGWSSELIRFFAGPGYAGASAPLQILGGCAALSLVLSPSVNVLFALERNGVIALGGAIALTVGLVGHLLVTSRYGAYGAAWTTFCAYGAINGFFFAWVLCVTRTEMHPLIHNKE